MKSETLFSLIRDAGIEMPVASDTSTRARGIRALSPSYEQASFGRRLGNWQASTDGINTAIFADGPTLRARSRDMVRKNWLAASAVETYASEVVGNGIRPLPKIQDAKIRESVREEFEHWSQHCDADGTSDFYGQQRIVVSEQFEAGECFARFRTRRTEDGLSVPLQIQLIESELVPYNKNEAIPNGAIRGGIQFNAIGKRTAYWMYREHPGDRTMFMNAMDLRAIPADQVLHVYWVSHAGQMRGVPKLTPSLVPLFELDKYDDYELLRKGTAALFCGFIYEDSPEEDPAVDLASTSNQTLRSTVPDAESVPYSGGPTPAGVAKAQLEPGTMTKLRQNERVEFPNVPDVGTQYGEFTSRMERGIAATSNLTHHQLTGDLTRVNFSSGRMGALTVRRKHEQIQRMMLMGQFCVPVYNRWFDAAMLAGVFKDLIPLRDYLENPRLFNGAWWISPGWGMMDPEKEVAANKERVRNHFASRTQIVSEGGRDSAEVDLEIVADNERADRLGLKPDSDPRYSLERGESVPKALPSKPPPDQTTEAESEFIQ